jgi:hypothetical protein
MPEAISINYTETAAMCCELISSVKGGTYIIMRQAQWDSA